MSLLRTTKSGILIELGRLLLVSLLKHEVGCPPSLGSSCFFLAPINAHVPAGNPAGVVRPRMRRRAHLRRGRREPRGQGLRYVWHREVRTRDVLLLGSVFMAVPIRVAFRRCCRTGCARTPYLPLVLSLPCCWWSCLCTQQWSPTSAPLANADAFRGHRLKIKLVNPKHAAMLTLELGASTAVSGVDAKLGWESKGLPFLKSRCLP